MNALCEASGAADCCVQLVISGEKPKPRGSDDRVQRYSDQWGRVTTDVDVRTDMPE